MGDDLTSSYIGMVPWELLCQDPSGKFPVLDSVGLCGGFTESFLFIRFVLRVIAIEPDNFAVPLKSQDVGRDPVEKPAVVADDDGTAPEVLYGLFQGPQRIHIEVIGRLVQ